MVEYELSEGDELLIGEHIVVKLIRIVSDQRIALGFVAPKCYRIMRSELLDKESSDED
ncbi:MAG: carbon storage regulator [Halobacteria archaeon]